MRVFTFLLMVLVALGGGLTGYRVITGRDLVRLSDFGITPAASAPAARATFTPPATATALPVPTVRPTEPPAATPMPLPEVPKAMVVAKTDGQGVYMRRTPNPDDKLRAWMEGSRMEVVGPDVQAAGTTWKRVKAPNGQEGYIPAQFLADAP